MDNPGWELTDLLPWVWCLPCLGTRCICELLMLTAWLSTFHRGRCFPNEPTVHRRYTISLRPSFEVINVAIYSQFSPFFYMYYVYYWENCHQLTGWLRHFKTSLDLWSYEYFFVRLYMYNFLQESQNQAVNLICTLSCTHCAAAHAFMSWQCPTVSV